MLKGNRGYFIVAGIIAFAFFGWAGTAELRCQRNYYAQYAYYIHDNAERSKPSRFDRGWVPCFVESHTTNPDAGYAEEKEQRDLIAQEFMALWAFWMAVFAGITTLVTFFGTILIWRQIILTRKAVEDTGEATKAMREANEIARSNAMQSLRAYVDIHSVNIVSPDPEIGRDLRPVDRELVVIVRNYGQTPAKSVCLKWASCIDSVSPLPNDMHVAARTVSIAPGAEIKVTRPITDNAADNHAIETGDKFFLLEISLSYGDRFGGSYEISKSYMTSREDYKRGIMRDFSGGAVG